MEGMSFGAADGSQGEGKEEGARTWEEQQEERFGVPDSFVQLNAGVIGAYVCARALACLYV